MTANLTEFPYGFKAGAKNSWMRVLVKTFPPVKVYIFTSLREFVMSFFQPLRVGERFWCKRRTWKSHAT